MLYRKDFITKAIEYRNMTADISDLSPTDMERLKRAVEAVDVLQIEDVTRARGRFSMIPHFDGWPTDEETIYDHFDTCLDKWGEVVSLMQPYDHVLRFPIKQELAYIAAGIALVEGPMRGFVGLLDQDFSWHQLDYSGNRTVLIAHTTSPSRRPDDFTHLLYYHFDSAEAAWYYLASHGEKCADRILWFNEAENHGWDEWYLEISERPFAQTPWVIDGLHAGFLVDEKMVLDEWGFNCR